MPVLAVDIGTVFTAVFLIVMFLGWVMQAVQGQNQQQRPARRGGQGGGGRGPGGRPRPAGQRPRPRRDDRIRSEIDAFLDEVDDRPEQEPVIEIVEPPRERPRPVRQQRPQQQRPQQQRPQRERPQRPRPQRAEHPRPQRPEPRPDRERETDRELGSGVSSHVSTYMDSHIDEGVAEHLPHLASSVRGTTGESGAVVNPVRSQHPLVDRLRNPEDVRQAILLTEILARPRSLRDRDHQ